MIKIPLVSRAFMDRYYHGLEGYLKERTQDKNKLNAIKKWYYENSNGKWSFESVVKAKPCELLNIKETFEKAYEKERELWNMKRAKAESGKNKKRIKPLDIDYMKNLYTHFSKIANSYFLKHVNALDLIEELNLKVCPYCNRNFITTTKVLNGKKVIQHRRTADLDHFYNKDAHPYLAVSLYNLIPSCKPCNHLKLKKDLEISPYLMENDYLSFDYDFTTSIYNFKISPKIDAESKYGKDWSTLGLEGHYESHSLYLKELIGRIRIYNDDYLEEIMEFISRIDKASESEAGAKEVVGRMIDKESLKRLLIGNIYDENQFSESPLSKLTKDIYDKYNR